MSEPRIAIGYVTTSFRQGSQHVTKRRQTPKDEIEYGGKNYKELCTPINV